MNIHESLFSNNKHIHNKKAIKNMPIPCTPWKMNMEPTNHPFGKENDLPNLHDYVPC